MVKRISKHHYVATPGSNKHHHRSSETLPYVHRGYSTDGEDSQRTLSEYTIATDRPSSRGHRTPPRSKRSRSLERPSSSSRARSATSHHDSDVYVTSAAYRPPSEMSRGSHYTNRSNRSRGPAPSHYSYRSNGLAPSEVSTVKSKITRKPGVTIETMSAPNPFCPNTKGMCCLMLLLNLGLILVTLGFVIVIQFFEPLFVWVLGIIFLIFGFLTLMGSLIYCVTVCRDAKTPKEVAMQNHYWAHHWQKSFGATPEIHYKTEKYPPQAVHHSDHDEYSDRFSIGKQSDRHMHGHRY
ncbi:Uncharacterized protein FWK35_00018365 [Aphis craccivora]|uniref:Uncharacterized protein n=1 Tax=Aphis craccivora TaxID=307492 RepID=A0A6G0YN29_APHCR|nr:Uncharacterized protein FWK35_00018365 [Aphis craccivora]